MVVSPIYNFGENNPLFSPPDSGSFFAVHSHSTMQPAYLAHETASQLHIQPHKNRLDWGHLAARVSPVSTKIFLLAAVFLFLFIVVTSPPVVRPFFQQEPTPTPTTILPSPRLTPTPTVDPFASVPTATPQIQGFVAVQLPAAALGDAPPTFTPTPEGVTAAKQIVLLPDPNSEAVPIALEPVNGAAPERLKIPKLKLNAEIQPVGWGPINNVAEAVAGGMPANAADVGWVGDSAAFRQAGNTVLTGRHQAGAAFHKLWTLAAGDKITLSAGVKSRHYSVSDVFVLIEDQQPLEVRLTNAELVKPTQDERLTLVTGGPAETQRTVVVALPK